MLYCFINVTTAGTRHYSMIQTKTKHCKFTHATKRNTRTCSSLCFLLLVVTIYGETPYLDKGDYSRLSHTVTLLS